MAYAYARAPVRLGAYELLEKLATGGMAEIYVARRVGPHGFSKRIALKRILPQLAADPEFVAMFIDEARVCAQLTHPNLVQVFDFGEQDSELYMAMELVEGTTGAKLVRAAAGAGETVPLDVALHIMLCVARGLEYAHQASDEQGRPLGLVHRDVSPGNILISNAGAVKLSDFGIARAADFDRRTDQGQLKGKLGYMSPEQVTGRELDAKSDQFTAAIVLAEMLIARPLFVGGSELDVLVRIRDADLSMLDRFGRHIPDDVRSVVMRALSRRPEDRFPTTSAFVEALDEVVRRRALAIAPARLVDWLDRLSLLKRSRSGELAFEPPQPDTTPRTPALLSAETPPLSRSYPSGERPSAQRVESSGDENVSPTSPEHSVAPEIYRLLLPSGVIGPLSFPRIAELFATGRVFRDTPVSREGGSFRPAADFQELSQLCGTLAKRWDAGIAHDASKTWVIRRGDWPMQLFEISVQRLTGLLIARVGERQKKVFFVEGVPEFTASTDANELLGAFLVARGTVLPMEVEMALALAPRHGGRVGDALVGLGVLRPMELARAVVDQVRERFIELVGWASGEAAFVPGVRCQEETLPEAFPPGELIARGIMQGYSGEEFARMLEPLYHQPILPVARAPFSSATLRLPPAETAVLDRIVGVESLEGLVRGFVQRGAAQRHEVLRAIYVGLASGTLASPGWPIREYRSSLPTLPVTDSSPPTLPIQGPTNKEKS